MTGPSKAVLAELEARITEHPWRTLGSAFLLGAWLALDPPHAPRNGVARAAFAMVGSLAIRVARELALGDLVEHMAQRRSPISATRAERYRPRSGLEGRAHR